MKCLSAGRHLSVVKKWEDLLWYKYRLKDGYIVCQDLYRATNIGLHHV